jgi:hypothetical protein
MSFEECTRVRQDATIVVSQKKTKFILKNTRRILVNEVTVDGCLIDDNSERCDYLFEICNADKSVCRVYYVELKGSNIEKACSQLLSTLTYCKNRHGNTENICYIVASKVPQAGAEVQNLKTIFMRKFKIQLFVKNQVAQVEVQ